MPWKQIKVQFGCMTFKFLDSRNKESHPGNIAIDSCSKRKLLLRK